MTSMSLPSDSGISTVKKSGKTLQKDVNVCQEDQVKINLFARKNVRLCDLQEQIEQNEKELQNLKDASDDLMLIGDDVIPYQIGEVFIHLNEEQAQEALEKAKDCMSQELSTLKKESDETQKILADLKAQLYAKFGENINLEAEES